jgi:hypothetical protein
MINMGNFLTKGGAGVSTGQSLINSVSEEGDLSAIRTGDIYQYNTEGSTFQLKETALLPHPALIIPSIQHICLHASLSWKRGPT